MSWLFRPEQWPRTPQDWFDRASRWPTTPRQWFALVDEISRSPTRVLVDLVESVSAGFVGRTVELETTTDTVSLELVAVACSHDNPPVAMGALRPGRDIEGIETVVVTATDVTWDRGRVDDLRVAAHDVRLETGIVTRIRSAPVEIEARIRQPSVDDWIARLSRDGGTTIHRVELDAPGQARVWLRPWLVADVGVGLEKDQIVLPVRRMQAWGVTVPFAHRPFGVRRVPVPPLAGDLRVTNVEVTADEVVATGRIERVREPIWLDQIIRAASTVGGHVVLRLRPPDEPARRRP